MHRLSRARSGRFVSVVAPPGYGKTTALLQWAARDQREFAWVSLDRRDNDPVVLLTYVAEALNADGAIEPAVFKGLTSAGDAVWTRGLPRLGAALAAREGRSFLYSTTFTSSRIPSVSTPCLHSSTMSRKAHSSCSPGEPRRN